MQSQTSKSVTTWRPIRKLEDSEVDIALMEWWGQTGGFRRQSVAAGRSGRDRSSKSSMAPKETDQKGGPLFAALGWR
jgi:hypothetical protein